MKSFLKKILRLTGFEIRRIPKSEKIKSTGDLKKIFSYVYAENLWGGNKGDFYSGPGSDEKIIQPYIKVINQFIKDKSVKRIVDLGCGDFRVGNLITKEGVEYTGIDIVPSLIQRNINMFSASNIRFECINAVKEDLPDGDLCLIRQVLQHLSNTDILVILEKCRKYKYVIVSEHIPADKNVVPNKEMNSNWDIRLIQQSGVYIESAPFNFPTTIMLEIDPAHEGYSDSYIRTSLIQN